MRSLLIPALLTTACSVELAQDSLGAVKGTVERSVVGGQASSANEIGATVALLDPGSESSFCTGTLVAPRVVVTAAHCVFFGGILPANQVRVVENELDANDPPNNSRLQVAQVIPHPEYGSGGGNDPDGLTDDRDIAVLILAQDASAPPTPILDADELDRLVDETPLLVQGYGLTSLNNNNAGVLFDAESPFQRRSAGELLAGRPGTPDTCNGDSGGPAYLVVDDLRYLVGVTSRAAASADLICGDGGIYTLAPAFEAWIEDVSGGLYVGGGGQVVLPEPVQNPPTGSCTDSCGFATDEGACACDPVCIQFGDCCPDFEARCPALAVGWECAVDAFGDGSCDCDCGAPDIDCAVDACLPTLEQPVVEPAPEEPAKPVEEIDAPQAVAPSQTVIKVTQGCSATPSSSLLALFALLFFARRRLS